MIKGGIDINVSIPHSFTSAAASKAKAANVSLVEIMQTAGWSSASFMTGRLNKVLLLLTVYSA